MANRVLSIEIGFGLTKVVEMDAKAKNAKIYKCFSMQTPADVMNDGYITPGETFVSLLQQELNERSIKTTDVIFTITSSRIATRDVMIPQVKENKVLSLIKANASDYFPVDVEKYQISYTMIGKVENEEGKQYSVTVLAAPLDMLEGYYTLARAMGWKIQALDFVGNSVVQLVQGNHNKNITMIVKIEDKASMITILNQGTVALQRNISYGVSESIELVQESNVYGDELSYIDTIDTMRRLTCIRRRLDPEVDYKEDEDTSEDIQALRVRVTESLRYLIGNILRVMDYFSSRHDRVAIDEIILVGTGSNLAGITKLFTNEIGQKVKALQNTDVAGFSKTIDEETIKICNYAAPIGAVLKPVDLIPDKYKEGKDKKGKGDSTKDHIPGFVVFGLCIGVTIGFLAYSLISYNLLERDRNVVQAEITQLENEGVEQIYTAYITKQNELAQLNTMYQSTKNRNEDLVAFIEELEEKMPSQITVLSFAATAEGVNMSCTVTNKDEAARTLMQLRTFDSIEIISTSGIVDAQTEDGISAVSFSVGCTYKPVENELEAENAATDAAATEQNSTEGAE